VYVVLKHMVEDMDRDWNGINQLIKRDEVLSEGVCALYAPSGGGLQPFRCLPIDLIPGLLFKIPTGYYDVIRKEKIVRYNKECYRALADYWLRGVAVNPSIGSCSQQHLRQTGSAESRSFSVPRAG
jgi:hypothetical protein